MNELDTLTKTMEAALGYHLPRYNVEVTYTWNEGSNEGEVSISYSNPFTGKPKSINVVVGISDSEKANRTFIYGLLVQKLLTTNILGLIR